LAKKLTFNLNKLSTTENAHFSEGAEQNKSMNDFDNSSLNNSNIIFPDNRNENSFLSQNISFNEENDKEKDNNSNEIPYIQNQLNSNFDSINNKRKGNLNNKNNNNIREGNTENNLLENFLQIQKEKKNSKRDSKLEAEAKAKKSVALSQANTGNAEISDDCRSVNHFDPSSDNGSGFLGESAETGKKSLFTDAAHTDLNTDLLRFGVFQSLFKQNYIYLPENNEYYLTSDPHSMKNIHIIVQKNLQNTSKNYIICLIPYDKIGEINLEKFYSLEQVEINSKIKDEINANMPDSDKKYNINLESMFQEKLNLLKNFEKTFIKKKTTSKDIYGKRKVCTTTAAENSEKFKENNNNNYNNYFSNNANQKGRFGVLNVDNVVFNFSILSKQKNEINPAPLEVPLHSGKKSIVPPAPKLTLKQQHPIMNNNKNSFLINNDFILDRKKKISCNIIATNNFNISNKRNLYNENSNKINNNSNSNNRKNSNSSNNNTDEESFKMQNQFSKAAGAASATNCNFCNSNTNLLISKIEAADRDNTNNYFFRDYFQPKLLHPKSFVSKRESTKIRVSF